MTKNNIQFLRVTHLGGPNSWTYRPVIEAWVDIGTLEDSPSNTIPGFYERLSHLLPGLMEHRCGIGERGGFLQRLREGTWAGHVLEHVVIELLNLADMPTGFGQTRSTSQRGVYRMVFRARDEQVARTALAEGHRMLMAVIHDQPCGPADVQAAAENLRTKVDDCSRSPSTATNGADAPSHPRHYLRLKAGSQAPLS